MPVFAYSVFERKPDLIRGIPVRVKKTHWNENLKFGSDSIRTEKASG
jgi:hypothetical protein